ncbi:hypothetical protein TKK_0004911 [Trichogramma kaykai]|uniref:Protein BCCIP homolog n=1 Tax=Trichogramma kaykai TaxID=54128 RepID=A0ABD2XIF3_9HYME
MSAPKRREIDYEEDSDSSSELSENAEMEAEDIEDEDENEEGEVMVDFEGRNPIDSDFHGIKNLLQQLFLKAHIDLSGLTNYIISQNFIGSVVTQSMDDVMEDDDDDDEVNIFGVTTVVNISDRREEQCIKDLRTLLKQMSDEHAPDYVKKFVNQVLEEGDGPMGLLINERFVNIPLLISIPLLENLLSELSRAASKNPSYKFKYYVFICKLYKVDEATLTKKMKNKNKDMETIIWSNPEEEYFLDDALYSFEFSVQKDSDNGLTGEWEEDDCEMTPTRKVLIFEAEKLPHIVAKIKKQSSKC